jgi:predicted lipid-binding transport protein (Tim44 family)
MVCYFLGGAAGSLSAGALYGTHGWAGVCILGAGLGLLTLAVSAYDRLRPPAPAQHQAQAQASAQASSTISSPLPS